MVDDLYHQHWVTWTPSYTWRCLKVTLLYRRCLWALGKVPNPLDKTGRGDFGWHFITLSVFFKVHWPMEEHGLQREPVALQIWSIWSNSSFCKTSTLLLTRPTVSPLIALLFLSAWFNLYLSVLCWSDEYLRKVSRRLWEAERWEK